MRYTHWLRKQVERLEGEIRDHSVFASPEPATASELKDLRTKVAIHTFLKQQLLRREPVHEVPEMDTQEFLLVKKSDRPL